MPLSVETHEHGLQIAERFGLSVYDGMVAAAALLAECKILYTEDMQHGRVFDRRLKICNPFDARC